MWLGQSVLQPGTGTQLEVSGGSSTVPRRAIQADVFGNSVGLTLTQMGGLGLRTNIDFANTFYLSTDSGANGTPDFYLWDGRQNRSPWQVLATSDVVQMNYGATINGTATVNGPASLLGSTTIGSTLQHTGNQLGFYGATPVTKPVVTGCTCDGSALKSPIQALASQGLVIDNTTQ